MNRQQKLSCAGLTAQGYADHQPDERLADKYRELMDYSHVPAQLRDTRFFQLRAETEERFIAAWQTIGSPDPWGAMIKITNDFHGTEYTLRAKTVGQVVSRATLRRVWRRLCGTECCPCRCYEDGSDRHSHYHIRSVGYGGYIGIEVVDT